jgi:uncharacterized protein with LGFP repeats
LIEGTPYYVKGAYRKAWELLGGQGSFGLPLNDAFVRADDGRVVQYFEAGALELRPGAENDPDFPYLDEAEQTRRLVTPIDLGSAYTAGRSFPPPESQPAEGRRFDETGYRVRGEFLSFYDAVSGRWRLGAPISPELTEDIGGVPTTVQYFQRGSLIWNAQANRVELGRLGNWGWEIQCTYVQ